MTSETGNPFHAPPPPPLPPPLPPAEWPKTLCVGMFGMAVALAWVLGEYGATVMGSSPLGLMRYAQVAPAALAFVSASLCGPKAFRLQLAGALAVGMSPFLTWFLRSAGRTHFSLCILILTIAVLWMLLELNGLARRVAWSSGCLPLLATCRAHRLLLRYAVIIPIVANHFAHWVLYHRLGHMDMLLLNVWHPGVPRVRGMLAFCVILGLAFSCILCLVITYHVCNQQLTAKIHKTASPQEA